MRAMTQHRASIKAADLQKLGISKPYAHQLVSGVRTPSLKMALLIQSELGVPPSAWPMAAEPAANDISTAEAA